jgi:hypothetical protein
MRKRRVSANERVGSSMAVLTRGDALATTRVMVVRRQLGLPSVTRQGHAAMAEHSKAGVFNRLNWERLRLAGYDARARKSGDWTDLDIRLPDLRFYVVEPSVAVASARSGCRIRPSRRSRVHAPAADRDVDLHVQPRSRTVGDLTRLAQAT